MSRLIYVVVFATLPGVVHAQAPAHSFEQLRQALTIGQTIVVTDTTGQRTKGTLAEVIAVPPSLTIVGRGRRTFPADAVLEIRRPDGLWNGALIGAGVGIGLATWDYVIDPSEPGNAAVFGVSIGVGAAIGAGIDALRRGGQLLYRSGPLTTRFSVSPIVARRAQGLVLTAHF